MFVSAGHMHRLVIGGKHIPRANSDLRQDVGAPLTSLQSQSGPA
jgi:hypothetical protein